jgi:HSP20 family molecular chaperone IbpA
VPIQGRGEIQLDGAAVVVTFHLPEFEPRDLEYRIGSRTVCLWSKRAGLDFRTIVVLPATVKPERFVMGHKNGVYEFLLEAAPPLLGSAA